MSNGVQNCGSNGKPKIRNRGGIGEVDRCNVRLKIRIINRLGMYEYQKKTSFQPFGLTSLNVVPVAHCTRLYVQDLDGFFFFSSFVGQL